MLLSGASGTPSYRYFGTDLAELGYYAVLVDGGVAAGPEGSENLRGVIARAFASPSALPGKVFVVGFSRGGGGTLGYAVNMPDVVTAAVAYYPAISWAAKNLPALADRIKVPVLVLAGEADTYNNCCLVEHMRELDATAKSKQLPLELVVYPGGRHGFNLWGNYQATPTEDAWRRTREMLAKHHPLKP